MNTEKCCNCNCDLRNYAPIIVELNEAHACSIECAESYRQKIIQESKSTETETLLNG